MLWLGLLLLQVEPQSRFLQVHDACAALWNAKQQLAANEQFMQQFSVKLNQERYFDQSGTAARPIDSQRLAAMKETIAGQNSTALASQQGETQFAREQADRQYSSFCH